VAAATESGSSCSKVLEDASVPLIGVRHVRQYRAAPRTPRRYRRDPGMSHDFARIANVSRIGKPCPATVEMAVLLALTRPSLILAQSP
jgi:hypothetical protein